MPRRVEDLQRRFALQEPREVEEICDGSLLQDNAEFLDKYSHLTTRALVSSMNLSIPEDRSLV